MTNLDERADVPVLTEIVDDEEGSSRPPAVDAAALEALTRKLERTVLERLGPEIQRIAAQALEGMRAELSLSVTQIVREAVATSVAQALTLPNRD